MPISLIRLHGPTYERDIQRAALGSKTLQALEDTWKEILAAVEENPIYPDISHAGTPLAKNKSEVYKVRVPDPDRNVGKSGGYRLVYLWLRTEKRLAGLFFYPKTEKENVTQAEIERARKRLASVLP